MLLVVDAGNTQTVVGLYELDDPVEDRSAEHGLLDHWRISTVAERTSDEVAVLLERLPRACGASGSRTWTASPSPRASRG